MSYYPGWLDYAEWILILGGIVCFIAKLSFTASRTRGILKLTACLLVAAGVVFGATAALLFSQRARHITLNGTISHVRVEHGSKGSLYTTFWLEQPNGLDRAFRLGRRAPLLDGEAAEIVYQDQTNFVFSVRLLDAPGAGFAYADYNDGFGAVFVIFLALVLALYGVFSYLNDHMATPVERDGRQPPPPDPESMLHLE
jgi:hypothetical protein